MLATHANGVASVFCTSRRSSAGTAAAKAAHRVVSKASAAATIDSRSFVRSIDGDDDDDNDVVFDAAACIVVVVDLRFARFASRRRVCTE